MEDDQSSEAVDLLWVPPAAPLPGGTLTAMDRSVQKTLDMPHQTKMLWFKLYNLKIYFKGSATMKILLLYSFSILWGAIAYAQEIGGGWSEPTIYLDEMTDEKTVYVTLYSDLFYINGEEEFAALTFSCKSGHKFSYHIIWESNISSSEILGPSFAHVDYRIGDLPSGSLIMKIGRSRQVTFSDMIPEKFTQELLEASGKYSKLIMVAEIPFDTLRVEFNFSGFPDAIRVRTRSRIIART